jgi:peptidoglycan/LPS O-acetylase OafA/YrhL
MKYIKGLDTLRAFAIFFVILEHWWLPIDIEPHKTLYFWIKGLVPDGGFGVHLFFVLSGFLITSILLNAKINDPHNKGKIIKSFFVRRFLRIFPVYYLTIIILVIACYPFTENSLIWHLFYMSNILTFTTQSWNNFSHTWSLAVEEQFYLIWPWFIIFIKDKYIKYVLLIAILIGVITTVYTMVIQHNWAGFVLMPSCMQAFGLGGLYAYLQINGKTKSYSKFIFFALPIALLLHFYLSFSPEKSSDYGFCFLTINSIISIWLIDRVINNKSVWINNFILENRFLNKIGQISYGIYLFHFVFGFFYDMLIKALFSQKADLEITLLDWKNAYFIKLVLLILVSLISFHMFEKPILKLKERFNY